MREVIIGAVSAFVVAVVTITFLGPRNEAPPPAVQQVNVPNAKRFELTKMRMKDRPFFRRNAELVMGNAADAGLK